MNRELFGVLPKKRLAFMSILIISLSLIDALGIFALVPIINENHSNEILNKGADFILIRLNISHANELLAIFLLVTSGFSRLYLNYIVVNETENYRRIIVNNLVLKLTNTELASLRTYKKDQILKITITDIDNVLNYRLRPIFTSLAYGTTVITITIFLLYENIYVATISIGTLALLYIALFVATKNTFITLGKKQSFLNSRRYSLISTLYDKFEKLASINKTQKVFSQYELVGKQLVRVNTLNTFLATLPRHLIEMILIGGILVALILFKSDNSILEPGLLTVFALGVLKLIPLIQGIFQAFSNWRFGNESLINTNTLNSIRQRDKVQTDDIFAKSKFVDFDVPELIIGDQILFSRCKIELEIGETYLLTGRSGVGKSTFFKLVARLNYDDKIFLTNEFSEEMQPTIVLQGSQSSLFPGSLLENLNWLSDKKIDNEQALVILSKLNFEKKWTEQQLNKVHINSNHLSGGQLQRLDAAQTLEVSADIYLFDEPFANLDATNSLALLKVIEQHTRKNRSLTILISHNEEIIKYFDSKKSLSIENGRIKVVSIN
jgi:ATP-binding cassette subfamily B protein